MPSPSDVPRADRLVEYLFRVWSRVYDQPLFQKPFYRRVHTAVLGALVGVEGAPRRVIDLGCGTAQLTADLAARYSQVVGVDLSAAMLAAARRRLGAAAPPLVRGNVYALPFAAGSVDLVTSTISYHWYLEPRRALAEIGRVLAPGGHLILATLVTRAFRGVVASARFAGVADHVDDLRAAGFEIVATTRVRPGVALFTARAPAR